MRRVSVCTVTGGQMSPLARCLTFGASRFPIQVLTNSICLVTLLASTSKSATKPPIVLPGVTLAAIKVQSFSVAKSSELAIGTATVNTWMLAGSTALQHQDAYPGIVDTPCPVAIRMVGVSLSTFPTTVVSNQATFDGLLIYPEQLKIVSQIDFCGTPGTFNGCTYTGRQMVLITNPDLKTLAHELGHYKGILSADSDANIVLKPMIMHAPADSFYPRNLVTRPQCKIFVR